MSTKKQAGIERTLLVGLGLGLLIGFISKRIAYGLLLGIGIALFMMYYLRPRNDEKE
ncbi:hypothetical protein WG954_18470 [Lacibacter sp. H375]|jgi:hypothetical protein|uniref:Uncharacterized protein n=1 Tax=Lacibacter sediminis TaxID=2760713 RepID=A0A7G5XBY8_9BACT|nr:MULTISPECIES: hypothetical protein [Lacibacter]QNA42991.1 hypothetical protein H4075_12925 [Lacibacter sediminis]HLP39410.1 hypothetical protein [Lacibacter sp.]